MDRFSNYNPYSVKCRTKIRAKANSVPDGDCLCHFGILGQKWGVRRFQNEDGTLTEEGKVRYGSDDNPKNESKTWKKDDVEHLSDEELRRRNNRLQQEQQYRNLTSTETDRMVQQAKKDFISKVLFGTLTTISVIAMRGKWKQAGSVISKYGKIGINKIKSHRSLKNVIKQASNKYSREFNPNYVTSFTGKRQYNHWPKAKSVFPREAEWPIIKR